MTHLLQNPIYNALISGNHHFASGTENVKYYKEDIANFAGLKTNSEADFEELHEISKPDSLFVVFSPTALQIPKKWELVTHIDMFQLVYDSNVIPQSDDNAFTDLNESDVEEMIALVKLTQPGPFLKRTIAFGNYIGVFKNEQLVSMAGHRFNPTPYTEVSAVCTHPDHLGNGYSFGLLKEQIKRILAKGEIPFLHVRNDNVGAIKLYEKLGFKIRISMIAYVIKKC